MELPADYNAMTWQERRQCREQYIADQKQFCYYCHHPIYESPPEHHILAKKINWGLFPKNFLKHPIHLHHSHETGLTIGAVHNYCNAILWEYHGE